MLRGDNANVIINYYCDNVQASTYVTLEDALMEIANVDLISSDSFSAPAKRKVRTTAILFSLISRISIIRIV